MEEHRSIEGQNEVKRRVRRRRKKVNNRIQKREPKIKTYLGRVTYGKNYKHTPIPLFILELIGAIFLDILKILKNLVLWTLVILIVAIAVGGVFAWKKIEPIYNKYNDYANEVVENATYNDFKLQESSYIYDTNGKLLTKLRADQDSSYIMYKDIPPAFVDAFVAIEDRTFWDNSGIDFKGIARVIYYYIKTKGEEEHGASTITQQLARNIFLTHEVSLERKGKEMLIAMKLTSKFSKEEIMEFYCNDICFANAYYGISAAAKGYFNKNVNELSLSEICYLCSIPNSPEYYNPYKNPDRAIPRRNKILKDMFEQGLISEEELNKALNEQIVIERPSYEFNDYLSTFAIDCSIEYLMEKSGFNFRYKFDDMNDYESYQESYNNAYANAKNDLYTGGYRIYTSLDKNVQEGLQGILDNNLSFSEEINEENGIYSLQGAITALDNETGKIIAVVGGRSQDSEKQSEVYSLNRAFQAFRQPGSCIKPLVVYTPAIMKGYTPNTSVMDISVSEAKKKGTDVQKLSGTPMTLRSALIHSKNGVAWQIFDKFGGDYCMDFLNQMEFRKICPNDFFNSSALGGLTYGTTTVEMAGAYSTLQNHGIYRGATCIISIIDSNGEEIYIEPEGKQVYKASSADTVVDIMKGVLTEGTGAKLGWSKASKTIAAGKTGTTNDSKDGWFCGFTPYYTVTVWVGYDTPQKLNNLYGATYPGQIWKDSMLYLIQDLDDKTTFEKGDYTGENATESACERQSDLPPDAYEKYLPGRDDGEELAPNYYVYDFRHDRVIGETLDVIILQMNALDKSSPTFATDLQNLYVQGTATVNTMYGNTYKNERKAQLDQTYNLKLAQ